MKNKIISILLAIAVSLSFIRMSTIKSSAIAPALIAFLASAGLVIVESVAATVAYASGEALSNDIADFNSKYHDMIVDKTKTAANNVLSENGLSAEYNAAMDMYYIDYNPNLTGDDLELAKLIKEQINSDPSTVDRILRGSVVASQPSLDPNLELRHYEYIRSKITSATATFTQQKAIEYAREGNGVLYDMGAEIQYGFSFEGPIDPLKLSPIPYSSNTLKLNGYTVTQPTKAAMMNDMYFKGIGFPEPSGWNPSLGRRCYSAYVIYNDVLYVGSFRQTGATDENPDKQILAPNTNCKFEYFNSAGDPLPFDKNLTLEELSTQNDLLCGFIYSYNDDDYRSFPITTNISGDEFTDDFNSSIPGTSVTLPLTDDEKNISDALGLGLVSPDSKITIDENGNITQVDGIPMTKLYELIQGIAEGVVEFEDVETYLQAITALLTTSNTNTNTINTVVSNVNSLIEDQSKKIDDINENVAKIAATLEIDNTVDKEHSFDIDTPNTIINKFPFCLPFDIYKAFNLLSADPKIPKFDIPLKMDGYFDYSISIDLSDYEWIAKIIRGFMYIIFIVGLILVTNKLIGRG